MNFNNSNRQVGSLIYWRNFLFKHSEVSYRDTCSWRIYVDGIRWNFQVRACLGEGKYLVVFARTELWNIHMYIDSWFTRSCQREFRFPYRDIAKEVDKINLKINFAQRFNRTMNGERDGIELIYLRMKFENTNLFLMKCNLITKNKTRDKWTWIWFYPFGNHYVW